MHLLMRGMECFSTVSPILELLLFSRWAVCDSVTPMDCSTPVLLSSTISWSLLKLMSIESVMPSNHVILCCPLLLPPSTFPSIRVFSSESSLCIRWPKYWSFSFRISPSDEHSGLISCRIDWLDLFAVQGTLKSLLQCHNLKACFQNDTGLSSNAISIFHFYWIDMNMKGFVHL